MASDTDVRTAEMLRLRVVENLTLAEIGQRYDLSAERVRQILRRCTDSQSHASRLRDSDAA